MENLKTYIIITDIKSVLRLSKLLLSHPCFPSLLKMPVQDVFTGEMAYHFKDQLISLL